MNRFKELLPMMLFFGIMAMLVSWMVKPVYPDTDNSTIEYIYDVPSVADEVTRTVAG